MGKESIKMEKVKEYTLPRHNNFAVTNPEDD
jgi:hypothetical protein